MIALATDKQRAAAKRSVRNAQAEVEQKRTVEISEDKLGLADGEVAFVQLAAEHPDR